MSDGQVVLVTGASSGIGRGIALHFGARGWRVVVTARREPQLAAVAAQVRAAGGEAHVIAADLTADGAPPSASCARRSNAMVRSRCW